MLAWLQATARRGSSVGEFTFDAAHPRLAMQLADDSRLYALWGGQSQGGLSPHPVISIRRHRLLGWTLDELIDHGLGSSTVGDFLRAAVRAKRTIIISGGTGTGKTTCARALAHELDPAERIITVELTRELFLDAFPDRHHDVVSLEARAANTEGQGRVTLAELVEHTLRLHPSRIWLGEILGPADVTAFLNALSGGHRGSCATLHANAATAVPARIQSLALQAPERLSVEATNALIASSVDFIVHLDMVTHPGGRVERYVSEVLEVAGLDTTRVLYNQVFAPDGDGRAIPAGPMTPANTTAFAAHGYDHTRMLR
jgi:Flp pilus assembly CpaF family ATPase